MKQKTTVSSMGTSFLESYQQESSRATTADQAMREVLAFLNSRPGPVELRDLIGNVARPVTAITRTVESLMNAGFVVIERTSDSEKVALTPTGRSAATNPQP